MSGIPAIALNELMAPNSESVDPSRFPDEAFDLYSIPAFDRGRPELSLGREIGSSKQVVQPKDVLLSRIVPHIRRAWVVGGPRGYRQIASGEWIVFRSPKVDPNYLRYLLVEDTFHAQFMNTVAGVGGSLLRARPAQVAEIEVPLPSLSEQRRIAERLGQADRLRRTREYALDLSEDLLPAAFRRLFGEVASRATAFDLVPIGDAADRVVVGHVGETAEYYRASGVAFLRTQNVRRMFINREGIRYVTPEFAERNKKSTLHSGDVIVSRVGANRGMAAVVPPDLEGANCANILVVGPSSRLLPEYLAFLVNSHQGLTELRGDSVGSAQGVINTGTLQAWRIPLPPLRPQQEFSQLVHQVASQRAVQQEALRQAEHFFQTLLHRTFSQAGSTNNQGSSYMVQEAT